MSQMNALRIFGASCALATVAIGSVALAQSPISALRGHNTNAPIDVAADRIEVQDRADRAIWSGNVVVRQEQLTLEAQRLTLAYSTAGGLEIDRLDASGGVVVRSPSETARGNFGVYDIDRRLITLVGDVRLERRGSSLSGGRLTIDMNSGRAVVDGGAAGIGESGGRVTGRFLVPKRSGN